jgi:hypothetical protein
LTPHVKDKHGKEREEIPEPVPPARPPMLPQRLIGGYINIKLIKIIY